MLRAIFVTMLLLVTLLNCGVAENSSDTPHSSGIPDIVQCSLDAGCAGLSLTPLRDTSLTGSEVRVWLFEGESSLYLLRLISYNENVHGELTDLTLSYPYTDSNAKQDLGVTAFWCDIWGVYIAYKARSVRQLGPDWKDVFREAEELARDRAQLVNSIAHDGTMVVVEAVSAGTYSNSIIAEPDASRSDMERIAEHIRAVILETVEARTPAGM